MSLGAGTSGATEVLDLVACVQFVMACPLVSLGVPPTRLKAKP